MVRGSLKTSYVVSPLGIIITLNWLMGSTLTNKYI